MRYWLTLYACSLAVGCLIGLAIANHILMALDNEREHELKMEGGQLMGSTSSTATYRARKGT